MITPQLIEQRKLALRQWFFSRTDRIAWKPPGWKTKTGKVIPVSPTNDLTEEQLDGLLLAHLDATAPAVPVHWRVETNNRRGVAAPGHYRLGTYTPTESPPYNAEKEKQPPGRTAWACIDFDGAGSGHKQPLEDAQRAALKVLDACESATVPAFLERSKSGTGYHVWVFFRPSIGADLARAFCLRVCPADEQLRDGGPADPRRNLGIEVFPKSHHIELGGMGNQVWLPWFHEAQAGNNVFLKRLEDGQLEEYEPQFEAAPIDVIELLGREELDRQAVEARRFALKRSKRAQTTGPEDDFGRACAAYRAAHWVDWPSQGGPCPMCGSKDGLKKSGLDGRWVCFSSSHDKVAVGFLVDRPDRQRAWQGDVVHLDAHKAGLPPREFLIQQGYLASKPAQSPRSKLRVVRDAGGPGGGGATSSPTAESAGASSAPSGGAPGGATVVDLNPQTEKIDLLWRSHSMATACHILETPGLRRRVLGAKTLAFNLMTNEAELSSTPLVDADLNQFILNIEQTSTDYKGAALQFGQDMMLRAAELVARRNSYHPVLDLLDSLKWDGVPRLDDIARDALGAEDTPINRVMPRKWMIGAVARVKRPGVKLDTALVLTGPQGAKKSSFFALAAYNDVKGRERWFSDTSFEIGDKDAFQQLHGVWIYELPEMNSVTSARSIELVKAFMSSRVDRYRRSYGRLPINQPRSMIFGSATNQQQFLMDSTGNRRWWPIAVAARLNTDWFLTNRDQLWAEAVHRHAAGEQWWLTDEESAQLDLAQGAFQGDTALDADVVRAAMSFGKRPFTLSDLFRAMSDPEAKTKKTALDVNPRTQQMVGTSLRKHGYTNERQFRVGDHRVRMWSLESLTHDEAAQILDDYRAPPPRDDPYDV